MSEHTPGPWTIEDLMGPEILSIVARGERPVYEWRHIAQVSTEPDDKEDCTPREAKANARLIAAAPDLLAALKDATFALALIAHADGNERYLYAARAAIAKAEGR